MKLLIEKVWSCVLNVLCFFFFFRSLSCGVWFCNFNFCKVESNNIIRLFLVVVVFVFFVFLNFGDEENNDGVSSCMEWLSFMFGNFMEKWL